MFNSAGIYRIVERCFLKQNTGGAMRVVKQYSWMILAMACLVVTFAGAQTLPPEVAENGYAASTLTGLTKSGPTT